MRHLSQLDYTKARVSGTIRLGSQSCRYVSSKLAEKWVICDALGQEIGVAQVRLLNVEGQQVVDIQLAGEVSDDWVLLIEKGQGEYSAVQDAKVQGSVTVDKSKWGNFRSLTSQGDDNLSVADYIYQEVDQDKLRGGKNLSWLADKDYRLLITKKELDEYIELLNGLPRDTLIAVDTETSGLRVNHNQTDVLVGISLSHQEGFGVYIPLLQKKGQNQEYSTIEVLEKLRPLLDKNADNPFPCILMNAVFDWKVFKMYPLSLAQFGIELNVKVDLMFMLGLLYHAKGSFLTKEEYVNHYRQFGYTDAQLEDCFNRKTLLDKSKKEDVSHLLKHYKTPLEIPVLAKERPRNLKGAIEYYFNYSVLELSEMFQRRTATDFNKAKKMVQMGGYLDDISKRKLMVEDLENGMLYDFRYAPEWFYTIYGPADADFPLMLYRLLTEKGGEWWEFNHQLDQVFQIEMSNIETIGEQEFYGVFLEEEGVQRLSSQTKEKLAELEKEIYSEAGSEFNINSSKQTADVLFNRLKYPALDRFKTKTGAMSVGKDTLDYLAQFEEDGKPLYPLAGLLKKHSKLTKLITAFFDSLPKLTDKGYLNPSFNVMGAATGRISCSGPNVQQMEPSTRQYIKPREGFYFAVCDFSQIERRLMGGLSGDLGINQRFLIDKEADSHIQTYATMMNVPYESVTSSMRKIGKTLNFATGYGISAKRLALSIYKNDDKKHELMAQDLINKYFDSVPVYSQYAEDIRVKARKNRYAQTYFGRRRHIKEYALPNPAPHTLAAGDRAAVNMVVQGTAADVLKIALARLRHTFRSYGYLENEARMCLNVHDEVSYEIANHIHPYIVCYIMKTAMELDFKKYGFPPLYVGMNLGHCWKDGKRDDLEAPVILMEEMAEKGYQMLQLPKEERPIFTKDPVDFWRDEVIQFSLREAFNELHKGYVSEGDLKDYETALDFHKNLRVTKYVGYLSSLAGFEPFIGLEKFDMDRWMVLLYLAESPQVVYDNLLPLLKGERLELPWVISALNQGNELARKIACGYFKEFESDVYDLLRDNKVLDIRLGEHLTFLTDKGEVVLTTPSGRFKKETGVGAELEELEDMKHKIKNSLSIRENYIRWSLHSLDQELLDVVDMLAVDMSVLGDFGESTRTAYRLALILPGGTVYQLDGWVLKGTLPILLKLVKAHLTGLTYDFLEIDLNRFASQLKE